MGVGDPSSDGSISPRTVRTTPSRDRLRCVRQLGWRPGVTVAQCRMSSRRVAARRNGGRAAAVPPPGPSPCTGPCSEPRQGVVRRAEGVPQSAHSSRRDLTVSVRDADGLAVGRYCQVVSALPWWSSIGAPQEADQCRTTEPSGVSRVSRASPVPARLPGHDLRPVRSMARAHGRNLPGRRNRTYSSAWRRPAISASVRNHGSVAFTIRRLVTPKDRGGSSRGHHPIDRRDVVAPLALPTGRSRRTRRPRPSAWKAALGIVRRRSRSTLAMRKGRLRAAGSPAVS